MNKERELILTGALPEHGSESAPVEDNPKQPAAACPAPVAAVPAQARQAFDNLLQFCQDDDGPFGQFEQQLFVLMAVRGRLLTQLFLVARHQRLDLAPYLRDGA